MTRFQKLLREQKKIAKYVFHHGPFSKMEPGIKDYNALMIEKSEYIYDKQKKTPGKWGNILGRI